MIALDGEPLKNITAVQRVVFVMKAGVVFKNAARGMIHVYGVLNAMLNLSTRRVRRAECLWEKFQRYS